MKTKSLLERLSETYPHPKREILRQFPLHAIARELLVGPSYLSRVLNGREIASPALEKRINTLADQIQVEQAKANNSSKLRSIA